VRPARDVRLTPELAHRRLLLAMLRTSTRVGVLLTLDGAAAVAAWGASAHLASAGAFPGAAAPTSVTPPPLVVAVTLVALATCGSYRAGLFRRSLARVGGAVLWAALALTLLALLSGDPPASPALIAAFAALVFAAVAVARVAVEFGVRQAYARGIGLRRAVLVGRARDARATMRLLREGTTDQRVVGLVRSRADGPVGDLLGELDDILGQNAVEEVVIVTPMPVRALDGVVEAAFAAGARCFAVPWALAPDRARAEPVRLGACPAFRLHPAEFELPEFLVKRALDLTITFAALVVALPLAAVIAVAIRTETRGPVFFRQRRVGLGGREFVMWKFRSMRPTGARGPRRARPPEPVRRRAAVQAAARPARDPRGSRAAAHQPRRAAAARQRAARRDVARRPAAAAPRRRSRGTARNTTRGSRCCPGSPGRGR
jgi:hypothetical protein